VAKTYTWKVAPAPTGRYRSFTHRGWPSAVYAGEGDRIAASIACTDRYYPQDAKNGTHAPLTLRVADYSVTPWQWRKVKAEFKTLQDAKDAFERVLKNNPELAPKA
jgi:hypothetical protein